MTTELAAREGLNIDLDAFERNMEAQRLRASQATRFKDFTLPADLPLRADQATQFVGYDHHLADAQVLALIVGDRSAPQLAEGESGIVILDRTPFYAEGGGQLGDCGQLSAGDALFDVQDTQKSGGFYLHVGEMKSGLLRVGDRLQAAIDRERRDALIRHHSATHLLNNVLRRRLGDHVIQTGSLVAPDYLRFDFSHSERIEPQKLEEIEAAVNEAIAAAAPVKAEVLPIDEAQKRGAVATFGEKYGAVVRIVSMGPKGGLSLEFCGGCHVSNTGDIQFFHVTREASPGAGNRRIEALAGERVVEHFQSAIAEWNAQAQAHNERVQSALRELGIASDDARAAGLSVTAELPDSASAALRGATDVLPLHRKIEAARSALGEAEKRLNRLLREHKQAQSGELLSRVDEALGAAIKAGQLDVVVFDAGESDADTLRKFGDRIKERSRGVAVLLGARTTKGPLLLFMADRAAVESGVDMSAIIRGAAAEIGGGGGGKADMAQAGGKSVEGLAAALERGRQLTVERLQALS